MLQQSNADYAVFSNGPCKCSLQDSTVVSTRDGFVARAYDVSTLMHVTAVEREIKVSRRLPSTALAWQYCSRPDKPCSGLHEGISRAFRCNLGTCLVDTARKISNSNGACLDMLRIVRPPAH